MPSLHRWCLATLVMLLTVGIAPAVIKKLTPLKEVLDGEEFIFVAQVDKVEPTRPAVVFTTSEHLKGKAPLEKLTVNLTGDSFAKKDNHTQVMIDRLEPGRKLVLFVSKQGAGYSCFGYMEGTWFQLKGTKDGDAVRWAFLHCEPFFRRTFKGTTDELKTVVVECLAGKRTPPEPDEKAPAGYGEPLQKKSDRRLAPVTGGALFGVIPSFVLIGPLAIIAALFPGVFARLAVGMKRWRAFLTIASFNSTLALVYYFLRTSLPDSKWFSPAAFGILLLSINAIGVIWAGRRYRRLAALEPDVTQIPSRQELYAMGGLTLVLGALVLATGYFAGWTEALFPAGYVAANGQEASGIGKEFTAIAVGLLLASLYAFYRVASASTDHGPTGSAYPLRLSLSGETVGLVALLVFGAGMLIFTWPRDRGPAVIAAAESAPAAEARILYQTPDLHEVMSSLSIEGPRLVVGAAKTTGFRSSGAVICVDRNLARELWRFDDDGGMKPVFATPAIQGGQVFAGEGLHTDADRRLFRLDLLTGKPSWAEPITTTSHTEGSPRVANGKVYFSAGDDGLYCATVAEGKIVWQLKGTENKLHIDTPPAVPGNRVYAGSGYRTLALLGLDAEKGTEVWRTPVKLRSFGPPLVLGEHVIFGLGTGNLSDDLSTEPEEGVPTETQPAGAVVCVEAATGKIIWTADLPRSVHTPLAGGLRTIFATCKDGTLYALDRTTGQVRWKRPVGKSFTAGPAIATAPDGSAQVVYVVSQEGIAVAFHPTTGLPLWTRDLRELAEGKDVTVMSTPVVLTEGEFRRVYFGAMLTNRGNGAKSAAIIQIDDRAGE